jgi:hypothetical protein
VSNKDLRPRPGQVLIRSKLERPPVPDRLVVRPRLLEQLSGRADHRLTVISAPAGYGKTSLALQCLDAWVLLRRFTVTLMGNLVPGRKRDSNERRDFSGIGRDRLSLVVPTAKWAPPGARSHGCPLGARSRSRWHRHG